MLPDSVGRYEILYEIGRGGMGTVYAAVDVRLNRAVAIKVLKSRDDLEPFMREVRLAARLDHPNVVPIYDADTQGDTAWFAMDLVSGQTLEELIRAGGLTWRRGAELVLQAARGIGHAHTHQIIHCDVKPGNILVSKEGRARVVDFGLARRVGVRSIQSVSGVIIGTPAFLSPEQARGERGRLARQTDVWGLGATLYEALTGEVPFQAPVFEGVRFQIENLAPVPPRCIDPTISPSVEAVCLKALEKDQQKRYPDANAFADDLDRALRGEPVAAQPPAAWRRWLRRALGYRVVAAAALVSAAATYGVIRLV